MNDPAIVKDVGKASSGEYSGGKSDATSKVLAASYPGSGSKSVEPVMGDSAPLENHVFLNAPWLNF